MDKQMQTDWLNAYQAAKEAFAALVSAAYAAASEAGELPEAEIGVPAVEIPKDAGNGDISSTFALSGAKVFRMPPKKIADILCARMPRHPFFSAYSVAGAGFINAWFSPDWYGGVLRLAAGLGDQYGMSRDGAGKRLILEFVSANPTGSMHLGNARGGVIGDSLAAVLRRIGYDVWCEFYVNDAGNQMDNFGKSIEARYIQSLRGEDAWPFPENGYHGDDIRALAAMLIAQDGEKYLDMPEDERQAHFRAFGLRENVARMRADLQRYRVEYDQWFFESALHDSGYVAETIQFLQDADALYTQDGAVWFRGTAYGAEKDEVIVKSNGFYTYYAVDIAYHRDKLIRRGFDLAVDVMGADHHGHTKRFRAGIAAIGADAERLQFVLYQLVHLMRNGEAVRMSKRTGKTILLNDLLDEISVDAARFFFNSRQTDTHLDFDLDLAVRQDSDNPVYYVKYAHARICTMLNKLREEDGLAPVPADALDAALLCEPAEKALIRQIAMLPEEIRLAARDFEPYRLTKYLTDIATAFHSFYTEVRIRDAEPQLAAARLTLAEVTRAVIANVLGMLKISAPEQM